MTTNCPPSAAPGMRVLFIATKAPFPTSDGGRLLMWHTLRELSSRGHRVTFVAPDLGATRQGAVESIARFCRPRLVPCRPGQLLPSMIRAQLTRQPMSILRHTHKALHQVIGEELDQQEFDVIHAEQVQSIFNIPDRPGRPPIVLRAQNVESHLWRMVGSVRPRFGWIARGEARKMAAAEARAVRKASTTVALTRGDGEALAGGQGMRANGIHIIPPPFPNDLPSGSEELAGTPPLLLLGGGWLPNRDSISWFFDSIWDDVRRENPKAHAHVFGSDGSPSTPATSWHPSPSDSRHIFCSGAILLVPLRIASGIRMKIIESWARGIPVVATPEAVRGLEAGDGRELLLARDGHEFSAAIRRLVEEPGLRKQLTTAGRNMVATRHDPARIVSLLEETYRAAQR